MVEPQPSKLMTWVRFPSPAPGKEEMEEMGTLPFVIEVFRSVVRVSEVTKGSVPISSFAHIAQSVEHFLGKEEVTGSIPVVGSRRVG